MRAAAGHLGAGPAETLGVGFFGQTRGDVPEPKTKRLKQLEQEEERLNYILLLKYLSDHQFSHRNQQ